jgi:hypothetical protein
LPYTGYHLAREKEADPIEKLMSSSSDVIVLLHVVLGLPLFLLPGGIQCRATLGIILGAILRIMPFAYC